MDHSDSNGPCCCFLIVGALTSKAQAQMMGEGILGSYIQAGLVCLKNGS